jgi:hypothetical protein
MKMTDTEFMEYLSSLGKTKKQKPTKDWTQKDMSDFFELGILPMDEDPKDPKDSGPDEDEKKLRAWIKKTFHDTPKPPKGTK